MIVSKTHSEHPPSYEHATGRPGDASSSQQPKLTAPPPAAPKPYPHGQPYAQPPMSAPRRGAAQVQRIAAVDGSSIYIYQNPITGEVIRSVLPPDHPQMQCIQQGQHVPVSHFGFLGIMAAIFFFPLGIGLCLMDRRVRCERCGHAISDGC